MTRLTYPTIARSSVIRHLRALLLLVALVGWDSQHTVSAGNVRAFIDGAGNLQVHGDHDRHGNQIEISMSATQRLGPTYLIRGNLGTTVNNLPEEHFPFFDVERNLTIRMGYGPDQLKLSGITVPRDLTIDSGGGDDDISLHASVSGNTRIHTRDGDDYVFIHKTLCGDMNQPTASGSYAHHQALVVDTGSGDYDVIWSMRTTTMGSVTLRSHSSRSVIFADTLIAIGHLDVYGSARNDYIYLFDSYVANNLDVLLRMQADLLIMDGLTVDGNLDAHMGMGNDFTHGYEIFVVGDAVFNGGLGANDFLQLKASRFGNLRPTVNFEGQIIGP